MISASRTYNILLLLLRVIAVLFMASADANRAKGRCHKHGWDKIMVSTCYMFSQKNRLCPVHLAVLSLSRDGIIYCCYYYDAIILRTTDVSNPTSSLQKYAPFSTLRLNNQPITERQAGNYTPKGPRGSGLGPPCREPRFRLSPGTIKACGACGENGASSGEQY